MGIKGKRKCSVCGVYEDVGFVITIDKVNFCRKCGAESLRKKQKEIQNNKDLNEYIYHLCGEESALMPRLGQQIKKWKEEYGWNSKAILLTLQYMYELCDPPVEFNPEFGLGNVAFYYYHAKKHYEQCRALKKIAEDSEEEDIPPRYITLKRSNIIKDDEEFWKKKKEKELGPLLDLNDLIILDDLLLDGEDNNDSSVK